MGNYSEVGGENANLLNAIINDSSYSGEITSRNSEILKSILDGTEYSKAPQSEIEELLIELKAKIDGGGGKAEKLAGGVQKNWDDGDNTETTNPVPLDLTEGEKFSEYLEYVPPAEGDAIRSGHFKVIKPFYGVVVPWVINAQSSGGKPRAVLMYNNQNYFTENFDLYDIEYITTESTSADSIGGIVPLTIDFKLNDIFGITAIGGTGYPKVGLKIYKFFDVTGAEAESFFDSISDLSV